MGSSAMATSGSPAPTATSPAQEQFLFTVESARATTTPLKVKGPEDESFRLTLSGVDPVTVFSDRPFRDAKIISVRALEANWDTWFKADPPNAVLTFARPGQAPASMVVELTSPSYHAKARTLSFTARRSAREHDPVEKGSNWEKVTTPPSMTDVSVFIDTVTMEAHPGGLSGA